MFVCLLGSPPISLEAIQGGPFEPSAFWETWGSAAKPQHMVLAAESSFLETSALHTIAFFGWSISGVVSSAACKQGRLFCV